MPVEALTGVIPEQPPATSNTFRYEVRFIIVSAPDRRGSRNGETPLRQAANGSRVRFLGLRTFDNPVVVGMEKNGNKTTLRRKTAGGAGGYEPGKIAADESKTLGRQAGLEYMARLQKAGCGRWIRQTKA